jgi:hypothetical protein
MMDFDENGLPMNIDAEEIQNEVAENAFGNNVLNVGMVLIRQGGPDPVFSTREERLRIAESTRLWAKFFCPGKPNSITVSIPTEWAEFFTNMLLSPDQFEWAKDFLQTKATNCLTGRSGVIDFSLPSVCPVTLGSDCSVSAAPEVDGLGQTGVLPTPDSSPAKKGKSKREPLLDSEVRRSPRLKLNYNEFKPSICSDRRCTSCSPPTLSTKVIRNLGVQLCGMDPEELNDEALVKSKKLAPISKRRKSEVADSGTSPKAETKKNGKKDKEGKKKGQKPEDE